MIAYAIVLQSLSRPVNYPLSGFRYALALTSICPSAQKGGNLEIVLPVVEALARGTRPPMTANYVFLFSEWLRPRSTK